MTTQFDINKTPHSVDIGSGDVNKTSKENLQVLPEKLTERLLCLDRGANIYQKLSPEGKKINEIIDYLGTQRQADLEAISEHFAIPVKDLEKVLK